MAEQCARTTDGRFRVYLYPDQTAELGDADGHLLIGRSPMYEIGQALDQAGYTQDDLVYD